MRLIYLKELDELNKIKNDFQKRPESEINNHKHEWERVFIFNPGGGLLNSRVFDICKVCGETKPVNKTTKISEEIEKEKKKQQANTHSEDIAVVVIEDSINQSGFKNLTERYKKFLYNNSQDQNTLSVKFYPFHLKKKDNTVILLDENDYEIDLNHTSSKILVIVGESTPEYEIAVKIIRTFLDKTGKDIYEFTNCRLSSKWDLLTGRLSLESQRNDTGLFITSNKIQEEFKSVCLNPVEAVSVLLDLILVPGTVGIDYVDLKSLLYERENNKQPFFVFKYYLDDIKIFKESVTPITIPQLKDSIGIASVYTMKESDILLEFLREQVINKDSNLIEQTTVIKSGKPYILFAGRVG